ncbi:hypothetical protein [Paraburkholderia susongensis]|uniref:ABM domain-containing protein n=1 Tax=Paraburkholderia susongensis TaxID=1515439 RepID=A0A1X7K0Y8_9BURK|nr:hypothetical protein [Paraburkholderia susongensis]SMG34149.1 hypothetical protein SAMN06265784_103240 [Paraburkholderia susongensis]
MLENPITSRATCARVFKVKVHPGKEQAYADYVRDVVEPIDEIAHAANVFVDVVTIRPEGDAAWTHARIFTFRDEAHRDALAQAMAQAAASFDGNDEARDARKRYAETLRATIAVSDYSMSD